MATPTEILKPVYRCGIHRADFSYHCTRCNKDLCFDCLKNGEHSDHQVQDLKDYIESQRIEAQSYLQDIEETRNNVQRSIDHLTTITDTARKNREEKLVYLAKYENELHKTLDEKVKKMKKALADQKKACITNLSEGQSKIKSQQGTSNNRQLMECLRKYLEMRISKLSMKEDSLAFLQNYLPKINEAESNIYDRTNFYVTKSKSLVPSHSPKLPSLKPRTHTLSTSIALNQSTSGPDQHSNGSITDSPLRYRRRVTTITSIQPPDPLFVPHSVVASPTTIVQSTESIIASVLPRCRDNDPYISSVCYLKEHQEVVIADLRNNSIHRLSMSDPNRIIKHTIDCNKNQPLFLAEGYSDGRLYYIEKTPRHGHYIHWKGMMSKSFHLLDLGVPNGFAVMRRKKENLQFIVTETNHEVGQNQNRILIYTNGEKEYINITERHSTLKQPFGVACSKQEDGTPYMIVTDFEEGCMVKMSFTGSHLWDTTVMARRRKTLNKPYGVTILPQTGHIAVTEQFGHSIAIFLPNGNLYKRIGNEGSLNGTFRKPQAITTNFNGDLIIHDSGNERIQIIPFSSLELPEIL